MLGGGLFRNQALGRMNASQFVGETLRRQIGSDELPGREFQPCQPDAVLSRKDCRQKIAFPRIEQCLIGQRAGSHDAGHFPFDQPFRFFGVFDLIADSSPKPGTDQLLQIVFQSMKREPRHRNGIGGAFIPAGERQAENFRSQLGIFIEQFIEISHAKQEQRTRIAAFDLHVAVHHGSPFFTAWGHAVCSIR